MLDQQSVVLDGEQSGAIREVIADSVEMHIDDHIAIGNARSPAEHLDLPVHSAWKASTDPLRPDREAGPCDGSCPLTLGRCCDGLRVRDGVWKHCGVGL